MDKPELVRNLRSIKTVQFRSVRADATMRSLVPLVDVVQGLTFALNAQGINTRCASDIKEIVSRSPTKPVFMLNVTTHS